MNFLKKLRPESLRSKSSVAIIVTAAVLVELTAGIQYWFAREGIREEVQHRAEAELKVKNLEIQKVMTAVESAVNNTVWNAEQFLQQPDSLYNVLQRLVQKNVTIVGAGLTFVADYYPQRGRWFEPYVAQRPDGTFERAQIGSSSHDYLSADFFIQGISAGRGHWSEPYYDDSGAKMMLCTFTLPVRDRTGQTVALLGADVSLNWLSDIINARNIYPSSVNVMVSKTGQVMVCPVDSLIMQTNIKEIAAVADDSMARHIYQEMLKGNSGHQELTDNQGQKNYVFYAPVEGETGWSMAIFCSDKEVFGGLRKVGFNLLLLLLIGMALLGYIIYRTAKSARRLEIAKLEKERISNELHIASEIQKSMVPKLFPPYPERDDLDIYATLVSAKEVGGDLYDFYIRDERLYFCIGDVSGKGVPASLVMAVTRSLFRTVSAHEDLPEHIVTDMNESMAEMNESNMFVTLFVGCLDLHTGLLRYCNAGHEAPLLIGKGVGLLPVSNNIPAGLSPGWKYDGQETIIYPHTTIFLFTDGLTEAEDLSHTQFGKQRMVEVARQTLNDARADGKNAADSQTFISRMTDAVHLFVGEAEQSDDLTMLCIKYIQI